MTDAIGVSRRMSLITAEIAGRLTDPLLAITRCNSVPCHSLYIRAPLAFAHRMHRSGRGDPKGGGTDGGSFPAIRARLGPPKA